MPTTNPTSVTSKDICKELREELRMTVAMRCYSVLRSGNAKSLNQQYSTMSKLFHGQEPATPSNLKLLCNAAYVYKDLYDVFDESTVVTSTTMENVDSIIANSQKYVLKSSLSRDGSRNYFAGIDIVATDLEKKSRNSAILSSGRTLLDLGKKGIANYRKALSFASKKFDLDSMTVKESGSSVDDVIEFVRVKMYQEATKETSKNTIILDDDDIEDAKDLEEEYLDDLKEKTKKIDDSIQRNNEKLPPSSFEPNDSASTAIRKATSDVSPKNINEESATNSKNKETNRIPPKDWFFPSWFSFLTYGPFVDKSKRLPLLEISDASSKTVKSRAQKRKADLLVKNTQREHDSTSSRGFSTDQNIQLQMVSLQRVQVSNQNRETILIGLCMEESTICKQLERAEKLALRLAPDNIDDPTNYYWKKVEILSKKQEAITTRMSELNNAAFDKEKGINNEQNKNPPPFTTIHTNTNVSTESFVQQDSVTSLSSHSNSTRKSLQKTNVKMSTGIENNSSKESESMSDSMNSSRDNLVSLDI